MDSILESILPGVADIFYGFIIFRVLLFVLEVVAIILIVRIICQYQAKENARKFEYEYLAECIAEEITKRQSAPATTNQANDTPQ